MIERQFDDNCDGVQGDGVELDFASRLPGGPLTPALAEAGATNRSPSPMIGMRGDLDGPAAAAEPVRGLAAFGSQGSINSPSAAGPSDSNRYYYHQQQGGVGPAESSRLSPRGQAPHHLPPQAGGGEASGGQSNGGGRGGIAGENDNTSSRERRTGSSSGQRSGARSNSPYRGGGGLNRAPGASSPGERAEAGEGWERACVWWQRERKLVLVCGEEKGLVFPAVSSAGSRLFSVSSQHTHKRTYCLH